ncbi:MAG: ABC transporter permease [Chloroflexi bacterium]|nr:ABC transporter permease [Chloroflexota bacterium]
MIGRKDPQLACVGASNSPSEPHHSASVQLLLLPFQRIREVARYRDLLRNLILKDFEVRYAGSALGVLWTQIYPLLQLAVFGFVFTTIFHNTMEAYPLFLFIGIIVWTYFSTSLLTSAGSIIASANLITKVYFPRELVPLSVVLVGLVDLLLAHVVLGVGSLYFRTGPSWAWLLAPAALLLLGAFCAGCGLIVSTATVYFHDVRYFIDVGLMLGMFLTPVFYPPAAIPADLQWLVALNPMATLLGIYRALFFEARVPGMDEWLRAVVLDAALLFVGLHIFHRGARGFAEIL